MTRVYEQTHFDVFRKHDGSGRELVAYQQGEMTLAQPEIFECPKCGFRTDNPAAMREHHLSQMRGYPACKRGPAGEPQTSVYRRVEARP